MSACEYDAESIEPGHHVVQFYEADQPALVANVGRYLLDGLGNMESLLVVTTDTHRAAFEGFLERAGIDVESLTADGTLEFLDAERALDRFMIGGYPDPERFEATIGETVRLARGRSPHGLRAYGEMVAVLWARGQYPAAVRLEQLWHQLMAAVPFTLFCAYQIDIFDAAFDPAVMQALLCAHTHLLSSGASRDLSAALERGMREVLGGDFSRVPGDARSLSGRGWAELPKTESTILWLRANMPEHASSILEQAKGHYQSLTGGNS